MTDNHPSSQIPNEEDNSTASFAFVRKVDGSESPNDMDDNMSNETQHPVQIVDNSSSESIVQINIERSESSTAVDDAQTDKVMTLDPFELKGNSSNSSITSSKDLINTADLASNFIGMLQPIDSDVSQSSSNKSDNRDSDESPPSPWEDAVVDCVPADNSSSDESIVRIDLEQTENVQEIAEISDTQIVQTTMKEPRTENGPTSSLVPSEPLFHTRETTGLANILNPYMSMKSSSDSQDSDFIGINKPVNPEMMNDLSDGSSKFLSFDDESAERPMSPWVMTNDNDRFDHSTLGMNPADTVQSSNNQIAHTEVIQSRPSDFIQAQNLRLASTNESATYHDAVSIYDATFSNVDSVSYHEENVTIFDDQKHEAKGSYKPPAQTGINESSEQAHLSITNSDLGNKSSPQKYDLIERNRFFNDLCAENSSVSNGPKYTAPPNSPLSLPATYKTQISTYHLEVESSSESPYQESGDMITPYQNQTFMEKSDAAAVDLKTSFNQMLLIRIGAFGVFGGIFASSYAQFSCRFAISSLSVGFYQSEFKTFAGLWQYSSVTNAFSDYSTCSLYGGRNSIDPPSVSRIFGILAFVTGIIALVILWRYLFFAKTTIVLWRIGVKLAVAAGVAQILTLAFFSEGFCRQNKCKMGPGSIFAVLAAISWFLIAYIMYNNAPVLDITEFRGDRSIIRKISDFCEISWILERYGLLQPLGRDKVVSNKSGKVTASRPPGYTVMV